MKWLLITCMVIVLFVYVGRADLLTDFASALGEGISAIIDGFTDSPANPIKE